MPYGPRGMPVMYPTMPLPPGAVPPPNQVNCNSDCPLFWYLYELLSLRLTWESWVSIMLRLNMH